MNKLSDNESSKLDLEITLNELHTQIFSTKNNKSPCPDGYIIEFFKKFWGDLKLLLLELMNLFFNSEHIHQHFLMGIITCIPKCKKREIISKTGDPLLY